MDISLHRRPETQSRRFEISDSEKGIDELAIMGLRTFHILVVLQSRRIATICDYAIASGDGISLAAMLRVKWAKIALEDPDTHGCVAHVSIKRS